MILDILFSSNHNIHKSSHGLCFWASDPLKDFTNSPKTKTTRTFMNVVI